MLLKLVQPSVEIFNIRIDEPVTTATDLLLAAVCFYAFFSIRRQEVGGRIKGYFKYYFMTLGFGALSGGLLGHAFVYGFSPGWKLVSWIFTLVSVAILAHALVELARPLVKPVLSRLVSRINLLILCLAVLYTMWTVAFTAVPVYTIFGMVAIVGSFSYLIYSRTGNRGMLRLLLAVGVGMVSAVVFALELGLSPWFNHNDISHVILSFSALAVYKGAVLILDSPVHLV